MKPNLFFEIKALVTKRAKLGSFHQLEAEKQELYQGFLHGARIKDHLIEMSLVKKGDCLEVEGLVVIAAIEGASTF